MKKIPLALGDLFCSIEGEHKQFAPILWSGSEVEGCSWDHEGSIFRLPQKNLREYLFPREWPFTVPVDFSELWTILSWDRNFTHSEFYFSAQYPELFERMTWNEALDRQEAGEFTRVLVPIRIPDMYFFSTVLEHRTYLPERVCQAIREDRAVLVVECTTEGNFTNETDIENFDLWIEQQNLPRKNVWYTNICCGGKIYDMLTSSERKFQYRSFEYFLASIWGDDGLKRTIGSPIEGLEKWDEVERYVDSIQTFDKKCLVLAGAIRPVRVFLYGEIKTHPELDRDCMSSIRNNYDCWNILRDPTALERQFALNLDPKLNTFLSSLARESKNSSHRKECEGETGDVYSITGQPFRDRCFVEFVSETNFEQNRVNSHTEKTYKPILSKKPFVLVGTVGILKSVKALGFKTFGDFWDESYDEIEDPYRRALAILEVLKFICSKDFEELQQWKEQMQDILDYNFNLAKRLCLHYQQDMICWYRDLVVGHSSKKFSKFGRIV